MVVGICLIVGSFLWKLVGENYIQMIITNLDQLRLGFCGFVWFFEVLGYEWTSPGLGPSPWDLKTRLDFQALLVTGPSS